MPPPVSSAVILTKAVGGNEVMAFLLINIGLYIYDISTPFFKCSVKLIRAY